MLIKKILAVVAMLAAASAFAAVDANKGTAAELDGLKGIGPAMSRQIVEARDKAAFKNWPDFMSRVKGVKEKKAAKLSAEGMTINGLGFDGAAMAGTVSKTPAIRSRTSAAPATAEVSAVKSK